MRFNFGSRILLIGIFSVLVAILMFEVFEVHHYVTMAPAAEAPSLTGRVVDEAKIFEQKEIQMVESKIDDCEKQLDGGQIVVLTVKTIGHQTLEDYSEKVAEKWEMEGKDLDDVCILFLIMDERKCHLEIGRSLKKKVTDKTAQDIVLNASPEFHQKKYCSAVHHAIQDLHASMTGKSLSAQASGVPFFSFLYRYSSLDLALSALFLSGLGLMLIGGIFDRGSFNGERSFLDMLLRNDDHSDDGDIDLDSNDTFNSDGRLDGELQN